MNLSELDNCMELGHNHTQAPTCCLRTNPILQREHYIRSKNIPDYAIKNHITFPRHEKQALDVIEKTEAINTRADIERTHQKKKKKQLREKHLLEKSN